MSAEAKSTRGLVSRLGVWLPLALFIALSGLFYFRLDQLKDKPQLASDIPSALIGKRVPSMRLEALPGSNVAGFSDVDLTAGKVTLVNLFGSWCAPCRQEHPALMFLAADENLRARGFQIVGIAYKDEPDNALKFIKESGNPYRLIGQDRTGRAAIDWGAYGVPESFLVLPDGTIAHKFIGAISNLDFQTQVLPEIEKALGKSAN